jgi:hypothetical protein
MKQRSKVLTKTCPSCDEMEINEENEFECKWGDSKVPKILNNPKGKIKECKLIRGI